MCVGASTVDFMFTELSDSVRRDAKASGTHPT